MTEYKTIEGHPIEVGKWYETRNEKRVYVIGFNVYDNHYPVVGTNENGALRQWGGGGQFADANYEHDLMRPAPEKKPVIEGWICVLRDSESEVPFAGCATSKGLPMFRLRYDPNKTGVDSVTVLEVREVK
jgi:hypothetical protein